MARPKSPKYPNFPLSKAIEYIRMVYDADRAVPLPREVIAKHLGYSGLSGASDGTIATIGQYGLLERVAKGEMKVSDLAVDILLPENDAQSQEAINQAALKPPLFREIWNHFEGNVPSVDALRTYLLRRDFHDRAIDPVMRSFEPTVAMMKQQSVVEPLDESAETAPEGGSNGIKRPNVNVGDFIQWESQGALQFEVPRRVRWISDDGTHLAVEGSDTGIPLEQVSVEQSGASITPPPIQSPPAEQSSSDVNVVSGQRKAVFPVSDGDVTFIFPEGLTLDGIEELEAYLAVFLKKEKRLAAEQ